MHGRSNRSSVCGWTHDAPQRALSCLQAGDRTEVSHSRLRPRLTGSTLLGATRKITSASVCYFVNCAKRDFENAAIEAIVPDWAARIQKSAVSALIAQEAAKAYGESGMTDCVCYRCWRETHPSAFRSRMFLCETCGNKRCPHATDHRNKCTGSNEPGQPGSYYGGTPV